VLLQELNSCTVNIPELKLLRQYHAAALLWISRFNDVLVNINEREDYHNGASLRIQGSLVDICNFSVLLFWRSL